jgi:UDP-3-O-[3-hydroxymyristoyl] glucosamine N-acyltransferase
MASTALPEPVPASLLAAEVGGRLAGPDRTARAVAALDEAGPDDLAFCNASDPGASAAGVLLIAAVVPGRTCVVVPEPRAAFAAVLRARFPSLHTPGVHPGAHVDPSARLGPDVTVHFGAWIGPGCDVGARSVIFPNAVLYPGTVVGPDSRVHAGAVLGADGFGYVLGEGGPEAFPHLARARLGEGVVVGANSCVDRGALTDTVVGDRSKLDNQVHVGHSVRIGQGGVFAAQVGIAGSTVIGDGARFGGRVGVIDGRRLGDRVTAMAQAVVYSDVQDDGVVSGFPARDHKLSRRIWAAARRLPDLLRRIRELEARVRALEAERGP